eukprot:bmy_10981T0
MTRSDKGPRRQTDESVRTLSTHERGSRWDLCTLPNLAEGHQASSRARPRPARLTSSLAIGFGCCP